MKPKHKIHKNIQEPKHIKFGGSIEPYLYILDSSIVWPQRYSVDPLATGCQNPDFKNGRNPGTFTLKEPKYPNFGFWGKGVKESKSPNFGILGQKSLST